MAPARSRVALVVLALCASCEGGEPAPSGASPSSPAIAEAPPGFAVLRGSLNPRIRTATDLGRLDPDRKLEGMTVTLSSPGGRDDRAQMLEALQTAGSPAYHHWLTPEQIASRFGARPEDISRLTRWLQEQGFQVVGPSRTGTSLAFTGTVGQLESAFHTEIHRYDLHGEAHFAPAMEPSVPADLADLITGLRNVHDFKPEAQSRPAPAYKYGSVYELAPADWATIYDVAPLYSLTPPIDGTGQKIAIAGQSSFYPTDMQEFRSRFGLDPTNLPDAILVPGSGMPAVPSAAYLAETSLDLEWAGAVAKNAKLQYVYAGNSPNYSVYDAAYYAIDNAIAPVLSFSYGGCEYGFSPTEADYLGAEGDFASMLGITFVVASGDGAAAGCDEYATAARYGLSTGYPASMPGALAVGGTVLLAQPASKYFGTGDNALSYIPEAGWNDTVAAGYIFGGTGGVSVVFPKPTWQVGVTRNDGMRDVPDVAFAASAYALPYVVQIKGAQTGFGGTSCATPSFAAVLALLNQALSTANPSSPVGLGNANPILYGLANGASTSGAFHDVVEGDNIVPCEPGSPSCTAAPYRIGYACGPGYDLVTGNGSVDAYALVQAWASLIPTSTALSVASTGTTEGSPVTLSVTVSSPGTAQPLTGDVIFYYASQDTGGFLDEGGSLGSVPLTATTTGGLRGGTAQLVTHAPPGLSGQSILSAFYAGDTHYLASWSGTQSVTAKSSLAVVPASAAASECATLQLTTTGGTPPVTWDFWNNYSASNGTIDITTGLYRAGDAGGVTDTIVARDSYGALAVGHVAVGTTGCAPDAGDAGAQPDSPPPPIDAAEMDVASDGPWLVTDARPPADGSIVIPQGGAPHDGCGCHQAGAGSPGSTGSACIVGLLLGVAGAALRRRHAASGGSRAAS